MQDARYSTTMPGAPDGEYVVLTFEAAYGNKAAATETVTAMMDGSEWRVAGYYIRCSTAWPSNQSITLRVAGRGSPCRGRTIQ